MNHLLPVDRLDENENWMAFYHPQPEYPLHLLILPKMGIPKLSDAPNQQPEVFVSFFDLIKALIDRFGLDTVGYRLITNGGPNQSIPQWHWHLISENWDGKDG
jgi:histidine triad (HIT) family protein